MNDHNIQIIARVAYEACRAAHPPADSGEWGGHIFENMAVLQLVQHINAGHDVPGEPDVGTFVFTATVKALQETTFEPAAGTVSHYSALAIARVCHEVNRAYCAANGDNSQPAWEDAPVWQQDSAFKGVVHSLENPDAGPEASHNSWLAEKTADGWTYGAVKDPVKREHPCFVPYEELPEFQQRKDKVFIAVVKALALTLPVA